MPRHARALLLLLLALVPLLALPARAATPAAAPVGPGDVYLALGDSLPAGFEAVDDGQPGFPTPLHAALRGLRPGIALENLGRATTGAGAGGETSTTFRAPGGQLEQAVAFIRAQRAAGKVVSPVTLSIGGNDAVGVILPGSTTTVTAALTLYRANLRAILDTLLAALTEDGARTGDLIVQNYYNPYPGLADDSRYQLLLNGVNPDRDLARFNRVIAEVVAEIEAERGVSIPIADVYTPFLGREALYTYVSIPYPSPQEVLSNPVLFDFHPRPAGHRAIADAFLEASGYTTTIYLPVLVR
ncbi:MAG TPA: SGNH/GDSL hydrolase family protein [Chloroflexaceae bacterium]|nr:SGNH/GDSL hydrolase family protein [Chloroflexaceae bacterium]